MSDTGSNLAARAPGTPATESAGGARARRGRGLPELAPLLALVVLMRVFFTIESPYFLNWDNWLNIFTAIAVTGIIAAPGTMLLISGQFDLSVGSGAAFCGVILATVAAHGDVAGGVVLAVLAGIGLGIVNGFFVTVVGVSSLITTLGTLAAFRGLTEVISKGQTAIINNFGGLGTARPFLNIPVPVILVVVIVGVFYFVMRQTVYGRSLYAIGANPVAARLTGIRSRRAIFIAFVLSGLCVALGGLILTSQLGAASPQAATGLELSVVTAVVLGGASLTGGRGTVLGTIVGLLVIGVLNNGLVLLNVSSFWQDVARGVLLILAVSFDRLQARIAPKR